MTDPRAPGSADGLQDSVPTPEQARTIATWAYEPPFDIYDLSRDDAVAVLTARDAHGHGYYPVQDAGQIVGFVCFGPEGRVAGQQAEPGTLDVGAGLAPVRLSQGLATALMPDVVRFAVQRFGATRLRAAVAAFNERSLRLCTSAGFRPVREFAGPADRPFVELILDVRAVTDGVAGQLG
jgi:[ribosomal protein S18]-alanine N-acetyltransferase